MGVFIPKKGESGENGRRTPQCSSLIGKLAEVIGTVKAHKMPSDAKPLQRKK